MVFLSICRTSEDRHFRDNSINDKVPNVIASTLQNRFSPLNISWEDIMIIVISITNVVIKNNTLISPKLGLLIKGGYRYV